MFGSIVACALICLMCLGQQVLIANGTLEADRKPTTIEGCSCFNTSLIQSDQIIEENR